MKFFFDNCISPAYVKALRILAAVQGYDLVHLAEKFNRADVKDVEWLHTLGTEGGWVIVSGDPRIARGQAERKAWMESGLTAFFLGDGWSSLGFWKQAEHLIGWWPRIVLKARDPTLKTGTGFILPLRGKEFKQIYAR